jgi:hypothetical protein
MEEEMSPSTGVLAQLVVGFSYLMLKADNIHKYGWHYRYDAIFQKGQKWWHMFSGF